MHLSALFSFPLKSAAAVRLQQAWVQPRGLAHDRRWMVCDLDGRFVTGRKLPRLSLIRAQPSEHGLRLEVDQREACVVNLQNHTPDCTVSVWGQQLPAVRAGAEADAWLGDYLQYPVQLVYMPEQVHRPVDPRYAGAEDEVSFADGFPLLLLGEGSLAMLAERWPQPLDPLRFRPNLLIAGSEAHAEDHWRQIRIGELLFDVVKPCSRCVFVNVDPGTGVADPHGEPLRTLGTYRRSKQGILFGQNLIARRHGLLRLGDTVEVLA